MATMARARTDERDRGVVSAGAVGAWIVTGLLGIGIATNVIVIAATTAANTFVQLPVRLVAGDGTEGRWGDVGISVGPRSLNLTAFDPDPASAVLARADIWSLLLLGGVAALLLVPVVRHVLAGRPFASGNARVLAVATVVVALGWVGATVLPMIAAQRLLASLPADATPATYGPVFLPSYWLLGVLALLLTLALVVRHGERVAADAEGLV